MAGPGRIHSGADLPNLVIGPGGGPTSAPGMFGPRSGRVAVPTLLKSSLHFGFPPIQNLLHLRAASRLTPHMAIRAARNSSSAFPTVRVVQKTKTKTEHKRHSKSHNRRCRWDEKLAFEATGCAASALAQATGQTAVVLTEASFVLGGFH